MIREYHDMHGNELHEGDVIRWPLSGREELVYKWRDKFDEGLGFDATNPRWIETGKASPCEYGIYPLTDYDMAHIVKV